MTSRLVAPALLLFLFAGPVLAQEPSLEEMRAIAREKVKEQAGFIKGRVIQALGHFKNEDAGEQVLSQERDTLIELGLGVIPPLVEVMQNTESKPVLTQISIVLVRLVAEKRATAAEVSTAIRDLLDQPHPLRNAAAIRILGYMGGDAARESVRLMLTREEPEVRAAVIESLARLGDESVRERFQAAMASKDKDLRISTLRAIRIIGDGRDVQHILTALEDADTEVVIEAIRATEGMPTNSKAMSALHDELNRPDEARVRNAIDVITRIDNKDYSKRALADLVKNQERAYELRELAAMAMYKIGLSDGMEILADIHHQTIKRRPKDPRLWEALGEHYAKFGAWEETAKAYAKAADLTTQAARANGLRETTARYWALGGQFKKAASLLKKTPRKDNWSDLANDPAFEKMKEDRRYRHYFER